MKWIYPLPHASLGLPEGTVESPIVPRQKILRVSCHNFGELNWRRRNEPDELDQFLCGKRNHSIIGFVDR
jgi:hypothetical protein